MIEDFLDPLGVSVETFRTELTGGWMFGYVEALAHADVDTVLVCVTRSVNAPRTTVHVPTGARMVLLPATRPYRALRSRLREPYAWSAREAGSGVARELAPYFATPARALADVVRRESCSALLCQEYEHPRFDASVAVGRLLRVPVFGTFQGGDVQRVRLERVLRPLALRACAGLIVGSSAETRRVVGRYHVPPSKLAQIFNPLDVTRFGGERSAARAGLGIPRESVVLAWHGRVDVGIKGLDLLAAAWRELADAAAGENYRLLLVGSGEGDAELRSLLAGRDDVVWVDRYVLDRDELARYLAAGDVYAFPSRREGFQLAPVEAMATGLPVVLSDVGSAADILDRGEDSGGVLVPAGDASALASALRPLLSDSKLRERLGNRAAKRAETAFSYESVGRQLRAFLLPAV